MPPYQPRTNQSRLPGTRLVSTAIPCLDICIQPPRTTPSAACGRELALFVAGASPDTENTHHYHRQRKRGIPSLGGFATFSPSIFSQTTHAPTRTHTRTYRTHIQTCTHQGHLQRRTRGMTDAEHGHAFIEADPSLVCSLPLAPFGENTHNHCPARRQRKRE